MGNEIMVEEEALMDKGAGFYLSTSCSWIDLVLPKQTLLS
jgi:hypothetical protein